METLNQKHSETAASNSQQFKLNFLNKAFELNWHGTMVILITGK